MKKQLQDYIDYLYKAFVLYHDIALKNKTHDITTQHNYFLGMAEGVRITIYEMCHKFNLENPFEKENNNDENTSEN